MSDLLPAARLCGLPPVMLSNPRKLCESHRAEQLPVQLQRRTRRHRTIFTEEQLDALEELFLQNQYPDVNTREKLAQHTHLREERVEVRKSSVFVWTHSCPKKKNVIYDYSWSFNQTKGWWTTQNVNNIIMILFLILMLVCLFMSLSSNELFLLCLLNLRWCDFA